jgi:replication factor C subunit 1
MAPDIRSFFGPKGGASQSSQTKEKPASPEKKKPAPKNTTATPNGAKTSKKPSSAKPTPKSTPVKGKKKPLKIEEDDDDDDNDDDFDDDLFHDEDIIDDLETEDSDDSDDVVKPSRRNTKSSARTTTRSTRAAATPKKQEPDLDVEMIDSPSKKMPHRSRKRKSTESVESEDDIEPPKKSKRGKPATTPTVTKTPEKKTKAPKAQSKATSKAAPDVENPAVQAIYDNIPTVRPPTPPAASEGGQKWSFKNRNVEAAAPGSKEIPEGQENCLAGLSFLFTGQQVSLGRDDGIALVKKYGARVVSAPSSKTDFVVLGSDAGPSKLKKIQSLNVKVIDEDGLFALIRQLPANGGDSKAGEKFAKQAEKEQEKTQQMVKQLEQQEKAVAAEARAKAAKGGKQTSTGGSRPVDLENRLLTVKYAPRELNQVCGNKGLVESLQKFLRHWHQSLAHNFKGSEKWQQHRAVLISGPPGIGKTTAAHLVAKLEGYDIIESNASDTRSRKMVTEGLESTLDNTSLMGFFGKTEAQTDYKKKKIVLIMDEVDGMSAGDRGGVAALAKMCGKTQVPMILICNDRRSQKMKPFDFRVWDVQFRKPTTVDIRARIASICFREKITMPPPAIDALIEGANGDIRQVLNMISDIKLGQQAMSLDDSKDMSQAWQKHTVFKPWDIAGKMLHAGWFIEANKKTLNDKIELYFNDFAMAPLMIQENYLRTRPTRADREGYAKWKVLQLVDQAAESISDGDLCDALIHGSQQQWSLLPTHAVFSSVRPASFMHGGSSGPTAFTSWLGKNSTYGEYTFMVSLILY